jgi:hypothetical protein
MHPLDASACDVTGRMAGWHCDTVAEIPSSRPEKQDDKTSGSYRLENCLENLTF